MTCDTNSSATELRGGRVFLFFSQQTGAPHHLQCPHCRLPSLSPPYRTPHHEGTNSLVLNTAIKKLGSVFPQICCRFWSLSFYCFCDKKYLTKCYWLPYLPSVSICLSVGIQSANFFDTMDKMEVRNYLTLSFITAFYVFVDLIEK